jgi:glycosyltransferase involved in cell wall biosynthesis
MKEHQHTFRKVLIISHQGFDMRSGGGITMSNLFRGWDKKHIALAGELKDNHEQEICENYYYLGPNECKHRFPFNFRRRIRKNQTFLHDTSSDQTDMVNVKSGNPAVPEKGLLSDLLDYTGLNHYRFKLELSKQFLEWVDAFSPDVIYSMLSSLELIRFVARLHEIRKIPVALHIMDDWATTITSGQLQPFKSYWQYKIDREFRKLLNRSDILLSIGEEMSEEYLHRYNRLFRPYHNPVDISLWHPYTKKDYTFKDPLIVLYAGRIGKGLMNSLEEVAKALQSLVDEGARLEFHIHATRTGPVLDRLSEYDFTRIKDLVPYSELPALFAGADILLLPNDFDRHSMDFLRFSIPTKLSEYMIAGTPILVYSDSESAIARHANKHSWGLVVSENNLESLKSGISLLLRDSDLRKKFGTNAVQYAMQHYDSERVRKNFQDEFNAVGHRQQVINTTNS